MVAMGDLRASRFIKQIDADGTVRLNGLPMRPGETVEIIVLPVDDRMGDVAGLSESALEFWDNDIDDQVWNDALSRS